MLDKYYQVKGKDFAFAGEIEDAEELIRQVDEVTSIIPYVTENDIKQSERFLENNTVLKSIANESEVSTEADTGIFAAIKQFFKRIGKILVKIWDKLLTMIVKFTDFLGITNIQMNKQIEKLKSEGYTVIRAGDSLIYYMKRSPDENAKLTSLGNKLKELADSYTDGATDDEETTIKQAISFVNSSKKKYKEKDPEVEKARTWVINNTEVIVGEDEWETFAFDPKFKPFTINQLKEFKSLIDYQYKQLVEDSKSVGLTMLLDIVKGNLHSVRENLKGHVGQKLVSSSILKNIAKEISKTPRWRGEMLIGKNIKVSSSANLSTLNDKYGLSNKEFSEILKDVMVLKIEQIKEPKGQPYSNKGFEVNQIKAYLTELQSLSGNLEIVVKNMSEVCEEYKKDCLNKSDKDIVDLLKITNPNAEPHMQAGVEIIQLVTSNFYKSALNDIKLMRNLQSLITEQVKALSKLEYKLKV